MHAPPDPSTINALGHRLSPSPSPSRTSAKRCNDNAFSLSVKEVALGGCQEGHSPLRCATGACRGEGFDGFVAGCVGAAVGPIPGETLLAPRNPDVTLGLLSHAGGTRRQHRRGPAAATLRAESPAPRARDRRNLLQLFSKQDGNSVGSQSYSGRVGTGGVSMVDGGVVFPTRDLPKRETPSSSLTVASMRLRTTC